MDLVLLDFLPLMFAALIIATAILAIKGRLFPFRLFALSSAVSLCMSVIGIKPRISVVLFVFISLVCMSVTLIRTTSHKTKS